jgi:hypothetical protein
MNKLIDEWHPVTRIPTATHCLLHCVSLDVTRTGSGGLSYRVTAEAVIPKECNSTNDKPLRDPQLTSCSERRLGSCAGMAACDGGLFVRRVVPTSFAGVPLRWWMTQL